MDSRRSGSFLRVSLILLLVGLVIFGAPGRASAAGVIFVKWNAAGANNGTSWANAYKSLQTAIGASVAGQEIWVAMGTYKPGNLRTANFHLKDGVRIYGGFDGTETLLSQRDPTGNVTTLSGEIGAAGTADNSYHVVSGSGNDVTAVLDGFTITAGNANGTDINSAGGGMTTFSLLSTSSPYLKNVRFMNNSAKQYGGAIYATNGNPTLVNATFINNRAFSQGGALYNWKAKTTVLNTTFDGNSASYGGAMYNYQINPTLLNVTFSSNHASFGGGGAIYDYSSSPLLVNVSFKGNEAGVGTDLGGAGGAMYNYNSSPTLVNVTFTGNAALASNGGAIINASASAPQIKDAIFWGDVPNEIFNFSASATISDSIVQGGCPAGSVCASVLNSAPQLGPLQNNGGPTKTMALGAGSAAIDKGNNATCANGDQRGVSRPQGGRCDMGAYEVRAQTFVSAGANDGWLLESGQGSGLGGSLNSTDTTVRLGDDASNRQFRSLLSFSTGPIPDGATVVLGRLRIERQSLVGTNPFTTHGSLLLDLAKPYFGAELGLVVSDFQAAATVSPAGSVGSVPSGLWYTGLLNSSGRAGVNKTGTTQLRLRFGTPTNGDSGADYLTFFSGNAGTSTDRPKLIVYYNP